MYPDTQLFIDGVWREGSGGRSLDVLDPVSDERISAVACAEINDLDEAPAAAAKGFELWRAVSAFDRSEVLRRAAVEDLLADATAGGATVASGGNRIGNKGNFLEPTVVMGVNRTMRMMTEEPFGPVALRMPFRDLDKAATEANRLPYGLSAYAFSRSAKTVAASSDGVETGMLTINHLGLAPPETPFGGIKSSGYDSEGGTEAMDAYMMTKFVTHATQA